MKARRGGCLVGRSGEVKNVDGEGLECRLDEV